MLGCIYGKRNSPWLNGTSPAFCLGLSGSNSDVKMNDRIPITDETHEGSWDNIPAETRIALKREIVSGETGILLKVLLCVRYTGMGARADLRRDEVR